MSADEKSSRGWISWALLGVGALAFFGFLTGKETGAITKGAAFTEVLGKGSNIFVMIPDPSTTADQWLDLAREHCGSKPECNVTAWPSVAQASFSFPHSAEQEEAKMFAFSRDFGQRDDIVQWNCRRFKREKVEECLPDLRFLK